MYWGGPRHNLTLQWTSLMSQQSAPGVNVFMIVLSSTLFLSLSLLVPCLPHYSSLTHYHSLHLTCSLEDFHMQPRSKCLFLVVRLTPFTSCSLHSHSHSFSVHLVIAQIYYCNLSMLLSRLLTHSVATNMHMLLLVLNKHIHWSYKKLRADKQRWLNVVSMKSNSPVIHYEHPSSERLP